MSDSEEQNDELLVLSEILEPQNFNHTGDQKCIASRNHDFSLSVSDSGLHSGEMTVSLMLDTDTGVTIDTDQDDGHQPPDAGGQFRVHHLPPLKLQFTLPPQYPSQVRPVTISISLTSNKTFSRTRPPSRCPAPGCPTPTSRGWSRGC